eukprot:8251144-Pyramimonas_sp.AAC.1
MEGQQDRILAFATSSTAAAATINGGRNRQCNRRRQTSAIGHRMNQTVLPPSTCRRKAEGYDELADCSTSDNVIPMG